jgi:transcriptional regulator with GAF, ATPase, and Fis domain
MGEPHVVEIVALLRELTAQLITSEDLDQALESLVETTARAVPGEGWCAMTVIRAGAPTTAAVSKGLPPGVDELDEPGVDGPSLAAICNREMVVSQDLYAETRWPDWRTRATASDVGAAMSVPLDIDEQIVGALTLYARKPAAFSPDVQLTTMLIGEHAGLLLAAVVDRSRLANLAGELAVALADGETVNRAIGIVMAQRGCPSDEALSVLTNAAQTLHVPLHQVADRLVRTIDDRASLSIPGSVSAAPGA